MADPRKYFQFNVTPKLGVTPNQNFYNSYPLETRQKLIQYQKQGGKLEQKVLDRLNSKQQFKNGGTLTQFLLKEGKL